MKDFTRPRGRLRSLPLAARVVYSVFLLFTLIALGMTAWLGAAMVGTDLSGIAPYYAGSRAEGAREAPPAPAGGPLLDLPDDANAPAVEPEMPLRKLLEVTHFHLFSMPVYLLILSHLFMLSRWSERAKVVWIGIASLAVAAHVASPWLARSGTALSVAFYALSGLGLAISMLVLSAIPLVEMWRANEAD